METQIRPELELCGDTIVAIATPPGEGAIGIVRLSGPRSRAIVCQLTGQSRRPAHRLGRVTLRTPEGELLDEGMLVEMHAPNSYTGEDVAEFHLHGAPVVLERLRGFCKDLGARDAGPGEFTLRAFLSGRMDLAQAEAVGDLIGARSAAEGAAAVRLLQGGFSRAVEQLLTEIEAVLAAWAAALDFPEYPTGEGLLDHHARALQSAAQTLHQLRSQVGLRQRAGARLVLSGPPNAGKSTLLNALVGEERVLVDSEPGTTRDPIEVQLAGHAGSWVLCDTAGIRQIGATSLEQRGIAKSWQWAQSAELLLWIMPAGSNHWPPDHFPPACIVGSKTDLISVAERANWEARVTARGHTYLGGVAAPLGEGLQALREAMDARVAPEQAMVYVVRQRHLAALDEAQEMLAQVDLGIAQGVPLDLLAMDLEQAGKSLGRILGRDVDTDVLDAIFAQFCIGK